MSLTVKFPKAFKKGPDTAVIFILDSKTLTPAAKEFDTRSEGFIEDLLRRDPKFTGKAGEIKIVPLPSVSPFRQVLLFGLGAPEHLSAVKAENEGGKLLVALEHAYAHKAVLFGDALKNAKLKGPEFFAHMAYGMQLRSYKFDKYKTKKKDDDKALTNVEIINSAPSEKIFRGLDAVTQGVYFARDAVNEPPNHLYPDTFARRIHNALTPLGVEVDIIDEKRMAKLGMGAALAVGVGSDHPPRMVVMRLNNKKSSKDRPLALVGKGITFDTGGISLKPGAGMEEMKMDMGGAAAVAGAMMALALNKSKANVVGIAAIAENMPSGCAYRPSDILKSYSGKTIEVLNTDAEGRLVLADALSYIQKEYQPKAIIDLATLTGAMMVALGNEYAGVFANDDSLWKKIEGAGYASGEKIWRMPLDEAWKKDMQGTITDLQNLGKSGRNAGACTAAGFLEHFIENKTPWAHMDIAGTAWVKSDQPTVPKYGTGYGVRLLHALVRTHYE